MILLVLLIGEYFIYDSNNKLLSNIRHISSSNNNIRQNIADIKEERRLSQLEREERVRD